jgi:N-acetylglucosamine kinase-like BadF-type ATPase
MIFSTPGFNPSYLTKDQLAASLDEALLGKPWNPELVESFTWYGAGCAGMAPKMAMVSTLMERLENATVTVTHDLVAAARAAFGEEEGLVAILGTGSHCARFDGFFLQEEAVNLGYLLGDEGGGADMGKRLLRAYFYHQLPAVEMDYLTQTLALTRDAAIEHLYRRPWANRWMASLTPYIAARPFLREAIARPALQSFADTHLLPLAKKTGLRTFSAVGSIAAHFEPELREVCDAVLPLKEAIGSPLFRLIEFHKNVGFRP